MDTNTKDLWVFIEPNESGSAKRCGLELLNPGKILSNQLGGKLVAVVIGSNVEQAVNDASNRGADEVIVIDSSEYAEYSSEAYAKAMFYLVRKYVPSTLIVGATGNGCDMAPRLACMLKTGLTANSIELDIEVETGVIQWICPAFGGSLMATIVCPEHRPQMGTVRPGVFELPELIEGKAKITYEEYHVSPEEIRTKIIEIVSEPDNDSMPLEDAEVIVAGGRGCGNEEGFGFVQELASLMDGAVGATRAAVDAGWTTLSRQIGQSGKNVGPKLYIGCGISGAAQHITGIGSADVVVAINNDPDAPIFSISDYGVVGDVFEVLPVLISEIKKQKEL